MNKQYIVILLIIVLIPSLAYAKDITLSLNQTEYYFKTGENAIIPIHAENTYKEKINGILSYTLTQSINQGNFQMSSSNTKSTNFQIGAGKSDTSLNFGTSETPLVLSVGLKFQYTKDEPREVNLQNIKIHFVEDDSQKKNQQNQLSSSSQKSGTAQQTNTFSEEEEQIQNIINQIFGNQQQPSNSQSPEQRLQNNQAPQDSSALRQQMQKQLQEQQAMKEEFQKQLSQNQEFQKEHQELLQQGYNLTSGSMNPVANNTGTFELNYQKQDGSQASLKGQMENGQMTYLQKDTPENRQKMLKQLDENKQFQEYQKQLQKQGFQKTDTQFNTELNKTQIQVNYLNKNNETASIQAEVINQTIQNIKLENNAEKKQKNYFLIILLILLLGALAYFLYKKFHKKEKSVNNKKDNEKCVIENPFDYKAEAIKLLNKAEEQFENGKQKDAYGTAGQALRMYLSYEHGLKKEITNDEIITYLRKNKKESQKIKECFDLCSLVEFAKYETNKKDFEKIVKEVKKIIK